MTSLVLQVLLFFSFSLAHSDQNGSCTKSKTGTWCIFALQNYPLPIAVMIPNAVLESGEDNTNLFVYLHGLNYDEKNLETILKNYNLPELLLQTEKTKISIVPLAKKAPNSSDYMYEFNQYFRDEKKMTLIFHEIFQRLGKKVGNILLATHSGSYRIAAHWINNTFFKDKLQEIYLIDAIYGELDTFTLWAKTVTAKENKALRLKLKIGVSTHLYDQASKLETLFQNEKISYGNDPKNQENPVLLYYSKKDHHSIVEESLHFFLDF